MRRSAFAFALFVTGGAGCALQTDATPYEHTTHAQNASAETYLWTRRGEEILRRVDPAVSDQPNRKRVLLYGGWTTEGVRDDTWEWDGVGWVRRIPERNPGPRMSASIAFDERQSRTLLFGGIANTAPVMELAPAGLWEWNGITWARVVTPTTPSARAGASFSWDPKAHRGYLFGGGTSIALTERGSFSVVSDELWTFDGRDWSQIPKSGAWPAPRTNATSIWDPTRGRMVLHGGYTSVGLVEGLVQTDPNSFLNETWEFDGTTWTQWPGGSVPNEFGSPTLALEPTSGTLRLASEFLPHSSSKGLVIHREENQSWVPVIERGLIDVDYDASFPSATPSMGSLVFAKGVWSGANQSFLFVSGVRSRLGSLLFGAPYLHDWLGNDRGFTRMDASVPMLSGSSQGVASVGKRVYVFAGQGIEREPPSDGFFSWDGGRWQLVQRTSPWPPARRDPGMAELPDGRLVLFGGRVGGTRLDDTWVWRPSVDDPLSGTWSEVTGSPAPSGRYGMAMSSVGSVVALFGGGGVGDAVLGDTWSFDGNRWHELTPSPAPSARRTPNAARSVNGSMWMFGGGVDGTSGTSTLADLWELRIEGTTASWTQLAADAGTRRRRASMSVDPDTQRMLLYGGSGDDARSEIYDFSTLPGSPYNGIVRGDNEDRPRRRYTAVVGSNATGGLIHFGGTSADSDSRLSDTWQLQRLGYDCTDSNQCGFGLACTEGVCCESSSCGPCGTCAAPSSRGLCAPRGTFGPQPGCDGPGQACSVDGHCRLDDQQRCAENEACASGTCLNGSEGAGVCCTAAGCAVRCVEGTNELQTPDGTRISCGAYPCNADRCATTCNSLADCSDGAICNEQKQCVAPLEGGSGEDPGCSCHLVGTTPTRGGLGVAAGLLALLTLRRRRSAAPYRS